jgi:hypothetical protein
MFPIPMNPILVISVLRSPPRRRAPLVGPSHVLEYRPMGDPDAPRRRTSQTRVLERLRLAARKGDRTALALALDEMRTFAFTPRYWVRYLTLLQNPLARLVDLLVIKQGDRIARQKSWSPSSRKRKAERARSKAPPRPATGRTASRTRRGRPEQPSLFPDL